MIAPGQAQGRRKHYKRKPFNCDKHTSDRTAAMPLVKAYDEIDDPRIQCDLPNGHHAWVSDFIKRAED